MLFQSQVDGQFILGATNWIGRHVPYHASALGKIFLAYGAAALPSGTLAAKTIKTITNRAQLVIELEKVRKQGFAIIDNELEEGLVAVAAPIFANDGTVIAAISISGPDARIGREHLIKYGELIIKELKKQESKRKVGAA